MNTDAAFFASIFVAIISLLASIFFYQVHGLIAALITLTGGIIWVGLGYYFKNSNKPKK